MTHNHRTYLCQRTESMTRMRRALSTWEKRADRNIVEPGPLVYNMKYEVRNFDLGLFEMRNFEMGSFNMKRKSMTRMRRALNTREKGADRNIV